MYERVFDFIMSPYKDLQEGRINRRYIKKKKRLACFFGDE